MKYKINIDNSFGGAYEGSWITRNYNNIVKGQLVSEWTLTDVVYQGQFVKPVFNGAEWIESETSENIYNEKKEQYKEKVNNYFSYMYIRALSSSMNKSSNDLNYLLGLKEEYEDKYNVSKGLLTSGILYDNTLASIQGEMSDEFTEAYLDSILPNYGLPVTGTHLEKMFSLIVFKFEYGYNAFTNFKSFIVRFRTKCTTWIDLSDWSRLDSAFSLVDNMPKELTVSEAQTLFNQFNAI